MKELRILVIEDNKDDRKFLEESLKKIKGAVVKTANSGEEALGIMEKRKKSFDLYIVDQKLLGMDGMTFISILRNAEIFEPVIIHTGFDPSVEDITNARKLEVGVFMHKSWNDDLLRQAVELSQKLRGIKGVVFLKEISQTGVIKPLIPIKLTQDRHGFFEVVIMKKDNSMCLSSQTGCRMSCRFCVTGNKLRYYVRGLTFEEMYFAYRVGKILLGPEEKSVEVLLEGMGDPLLNIEQVETLIERLDNGDSARISTVVPSVKRLKNFLNIVKDNGKIRNRLRQMQISLHFIQERGKHIPYSKRVMMKEALNLLQGFFKETGIEGCLNYAVFSGINDSQNDIEGLVNLLEDYEDLVLRLSVANPYGEYQPVSMENMEDIRNRIIDSGIKEKRVKEIFVSSGGEIRAACGQLGSEKAYFQSSYGDIYEMDN